MGKLDSWTVGQLDSWTVGRLDSWTVGQIRKYFLKTGYKVVKIRINSKTIYMAGSYKDLLVYQKAFNLALLIFKVSGNFDKAEKYSLTDQIRRSSRSVCANLAEAYRKRQYESYFVSKISDADMENSETRVWLDFALSFGYMKDEVHFDLYSRSEEIGRLLNHMMQNPEKYRGSMKSKK